MEDIIRDIREIALDGIGRAKDRWEHMRWTAVLGKLDEMAVTERDGAMVTLSDGDAES